MSIIDLGQIMLDAYGAEECQNGYDTVDPHWVGYYALEYGDINEDGTLN